MTSTKTSLDEVFESLLTEAVQLGFVDVHFAPDARASGFIGSTKQFVRFGDRVSTDQFERAADRLAPNHGSVATSGARWRFMNTDGCVVFRKLPSPEESSQAARDSGGDRG